MNGIRIVIMAKRPSSGQAKTRLIADGFLDAAGAARVAEAMLDCTLERLATRGDVLLAVAPDGAADETWPARPRGGRVEIVDQGPGAFGDRLDRVWRRLDPDEPVAFFGADAPDVPDAALAAIAPALREADVAVGSTSDGGYWTLAARAYAPQVLADIDWGSDAVYDQTCRRAVGAGLSLHALPVWHDIDRPADVVALRRRLARATDPPLRRLSQRLAAVLPASCPDSQDRTDSDHEPT